MKKEIFSKGVLYVFINFIPVDSSIKEMGDISVIYILA